MVETKGYNDATLAQVSDELHQRAGNTFLWVALVCNKLELMYEWNAIKIIKQMPPGLPKRYEHMMARLEGTMEQGDGSPPTDTRWPQRLSHDHRLLARQ